MPSPVEALLGEHAGLADLVEVERYAEQGARQRAQCAPRPELGRARGRVDQVEAELLGEPDRLGTTGQHGLGAHVDLDAAHDAGPELAADVGRAFEQEHGEPGTAELTSSGQAGETAADHHDIGSGGHAGHSPTPPGISDGAGGPARTGRSASLC